MPEGDTIAYAARRMRPLLEGQVPDGIRTPQPRHRLDRWPERLAGRAIEEIRTQGKHLFLRFAGELTIHSHLRMTRFDQRLAGLGPDILAEEFDYVRFLARLRGDDYARGIGDALLDQRNVAGIGNLLKSEGCWQAAVDPWRLVADVVDAEATAIIDAVRPLMLESAETGDQDSHRRVFRRNGQPCPRCGAKILARGQGEDNRTTFWCPSCQR